MFKTCVIIFYALKKYISLELLFNQNTAGDFLYNIQVDLFVVDPSSLHKIKESLQITRSNIIHYYVVLDR